MPSPNGFLTAIDVSRIDRSWARGTVHYDLTQPPWDNTDPQLGAWTLEYFVGNSATGPWRPAPLTSPATQCVTRPTNRTGLEQSDGVTIGVGGVGGTQPPQPDTDYWVRVLVHDETDAVLDDWVQGPFHTAAHPTFTCLVPTNVDQTSADVRLATVSGQLNVSAPCNQDGITWELATNAAGPWTAFPREVATDFTPGRTFSGLTPDTTYFYRARLDESITGAPAEYAVTEPCSFKTLAVPVTTPPFDPQPCAMDDGDGACLPPMQFCQNSTTTGPVEHPGRQYDITLPINPGFAVESMTVGSTVSTANIVWDVNDPDGEKFRATLTAFMESRLPAAATVTITNPNAGTPQVCGVAAAMQVHIECLRLDQDPPDLIELAYNGGRDLIQNPAYNESPALNPPVSQGNYGYRLLSRQDDPGPFPGFQPANDALCTDTANRGWETNDRGRTFEIWGKDVAGGVTPTPRGTPVQEITSDGPPVSGGRSTIWQTFTAPFSGDFIIRIVHGGRDDGENHRITLDNGDTDDQQNGHLINDVTNPARVYNGNAWTVFNQTIPLVAGQTYTLALSTSDGIVDARGGLFTDMRAFQNLPGQRATAATNDDTCVVTTTETQRTSVCSFWQPSCTAGAITGWTKVDTGLVLTNAEFWAQTPTPACCQSTAPEGGGGGSLSNMLTSDTVCGEVGGLLQSMIRVIVTDPSGNVTQETFIAKDGQPVQPTTWRPGSCDTNDAETQILCDVDPGTGATIAFVREFLFDGAGAILLVRDLDLETGAPYTIRGDVRDCSQSVPGVERLTLCDVHADGTTTTFIRQFITRNGATTGTLDVLPDGAAYTPTGTVSDCDQALDPIATTGLCLSDGTPVAVVTRRDSTTGAITRDGWVNLATGAFTAGAPPVGTVACGSSRSIEVSGVFCDVTGSTVNALVLVEYQYAADGSISSVRLVDATTGATHTVVGTITTCPADTGQPEQDAAILCDVAAGGTSTPFVRDYRRDSTGAIVAASNYTLAGAPYNPTGTVGVCAGRDAESVILCDSATTPNRFLRTYTYDASGAVAGFTDRTLAGAAFTPTGTVGICTTPVTPEVDIDQVVMSDANGTCFIRRFTFNSATGVVTSTVNLTLAGAAFTPVGAVTAGCSTCCPQVLADDLCTNTGSGRASAIRAANGTVSLIDSVTGAAVSAAQIVPCPGDDTVRTLTAEARVITDGAPWLPSEVVGTITSLTVTGTAGLWDLVDGNGTALTGLPAGLTLTWEAEDDNQLVPPQSVTPQAGATVVANWTRR